MQPERPATSDQRLIFEGIESSVEFFRNTNIDFLGKKWYFLAFSLIFSVAGLFSMLFWHHIPWGVDFRGGTLVYVRFSHPPDYSAIAQGMNRAGLRSPKIQRYGPVSNNEVLIDLDVRETSEQALDEGKVKIIQALEKTKEPPDKICTNSSKCDLNNASFLTIKKYLIEKDPMHIGSDDQKYSAQAQAIVDYREKVQGGVLNSPDQLQAAPGVDRAVAASLADGFFVSDFGVRNVVIIGPQVGSQLRTQAGLATL